MRILVYSKWKITHVMCQVLPFIEFKSSSSHNSTGDIAPGTSFLFEKKSRGIFFDLRA